MKTRLLLVDDHQMFLDGLVEILSKEENYELVGTAKNGQHALEIISTEKINIVITDVSMPIMDGEELLTKIRAQFKDVRVIMLTMDDSGKRISKLIRSGADSYLFKNASKEELIEAIDHVARGEHFFNARVQQSILDNIVPDRKVEQMHKIKEDLTEREKQILIMISQEFTQQEIAEQLFISPNTVVYHKRKLMLLLDVKSVAGLVRKSAEMGLI
ncbi:MAG: response regulator transcription factor [Crocinitomicaceae bacterium]|nr:response regulator transcription factor [Flavobacteriales bacterium]NQZ35493.1 response regulator transcription factor [Crocinitomicaceae bacterium]